MKQKQKIPAPAKPRRIRANGTENDELAQLAKALGHPARVAIMRLLLTGGECICGAIVNRLPLSQATVSQHLKVLKEAGWIKGEVDGPRVCYCAQPGTLARLVALLRALEPATEIKVERSKI